MRGSLASGSFASGWFGFAPGQNGPPGKIRTGGSAAGREAAAGTAVLGSADPIHAPGAVA